MLMFFVLINRVVQRGRIINQMMRLFDFTPIRQDLDCVAKF